MPEKTVNIILAVGSIVVLLILGYTLFGMIFKQQEYQQAKATMDGITQTMDGMKAGDTKTYLIESPKNWGLFSYKDNLCICKYSGFKSDDFSNDELFLKDCMIAGVCIKTSSNLILKKPETSSILNGFDCVYYPSNWVAAVWTNWVGGYPPLEKYCYNFYKVPVELKISLDSTNSTSFSLRNQ